MVRASKGSIGLALIGCGKIGALRAALAAGHPAVDYLALYDLDKGRAGALAEQTGADLVADSIEQVLDDPQVDAVIVSTSEEAHVGPVRAALESGRPVLVEKPLAHDLAEAKDLVDAAEASGQALSVGYTQRFRRRFLNGKEQIDKGFLGELSGMSGKMYTTRAIARAILERSPHVNAVTDILTYMVDITLWYFEGHRPVSVYAQSSGGSLGKEFGCPETTFAVLRMDSGAIVNLGTSWQLPRHYPSNSTILVDVFGDEGFMAIDDSHRDFPMASDRQLESPYVGIPMQFTFVGTHAPADWAVGELWGPIREETYAFIEALTRGESHPVIPDARHAQKVLAITTAINQSWQAEGGDREIALDLP